MDYEESREVQSLQRTDFLIRPRLERTLSQVYQGKYPDAPEYPSLHVKASSLHFTSTQVGLLRAGGSG